tara:strand:- start:944 stop:1243 length:300 start_codon:yes stop_codon:yes gene_type:complete
MKSVILKITIAMEILMKGIIFALVGKYVHMDHVLQINVLLIANVKEGVLNIVVKEISNALSLMLIFAKIINVLRYSLNVLVIYVHSDAILILISVLRGR